MRVAELKARERERAWIKRLFSVEKAELIALFRDNLQPSTRPSSREPRPRPPPATRTRPPRPSRPPPPPPLAPPLQEQLVGFRPDILRQPELMRKLEGIHTPPAPTAPWRPPPK